MAVTRDWVLYDYGAPSHAAGATVTLFDQSESAATNNEQDTNMPIAGQLPSTQGFKFDKIGVILDWVAGIANANDQQEFLDQATVEILIAEKRVFIAPMHILLAPGQAGADTVAAGATQYANQVNWFTFKHPIEIKGGVPFKVVCTQGITDTTANHTVGVCLVGELTTPD